MRLFFYLCALLCAPLAATAQTGSDTILILDGSGSMWGQIEGKPKIAIAQEVIADLLDRLPETQSLGLMAYGHRNRGDCSDIETIVAPGPDTRAQIAVAVAGITPLGKTPMTDAVIAAAQSLNYTEEKATVILISDGVETCHPDPCSAATALAQAGVDFTAHVIGFDVAGDPAAVAQMQCLAAATGGSFLSAGNASELAQALDSVTTQHPQSAAPVAVEFEALLGIDGPDISEAVMWSLNGPGTAVDFIGSPFVADLAPGTYEVTAAYTAENRVERQSFTVNRTTMVVRVIFPVVLPPVTLGAPETAMATMTIPVSYDLPAADGDFVQIVDPVSNAGFGFANAMDGNPVMLPMPPSPGRYDIRYFNARYQQLGSRPITVTPATVSLTAPPMVVAGSTVAVDWTGPNAEGDYLAIGSSGGSDQASWAYTADGRPAMILAPATAGEYELRYTTADYSVLATVPLTVAPVNAQIYVQSTAKPGEIVSVTFEGPLYPADYIAVFAAGQTGWTHYAYLDQGNPAALQLPDMTGQYEVGYVLGATNTVIATAPLTIE